MASNPKPEHQPRSPSDAELQLLQRLLKDLEKAERSSRLSQIALVFCSTTAFGASVWLLLSHRSEFALSGSLAISLGFLSAFLLLFFVNLQKQRSYQRSIISAIRLNEAHDTISIIRKLAISLPGEPGQTPAKIPAPPNFDND